MDQQDFYIQKTYASLQDCLSRYTNNLELKASIKKELQVIELGLERVNNNVIKIAIFGLVSRGKSAIVNALVGQNIFNSNERYKKSLFIYKIFGRRISYKICKTF